MRVGTRRIHGMTNAARGFFDVVHGELFGKDVAADSHRNRARFDVIDDVVGGDAVGGNERNSRKRSAHGTDVVGATQARRGKHFDETRAVTMRGEYFSGCRSTGHGKQPETVRLVYHFTVEHGREYETTARFGDIAHVVHGEHGAAAGDGFSPVSKV